jgi:hypothetical protein
MDPTFPPSIDYQGIKHDLDIIFDQCLGLAMSWFPGFYLQNLSLACKSLTFDPTHHLKVLKKDHSLEVLLVSLFPFPFLVQLFSSFCGAHSSGSPWCSPSLLLFVDLASIMAESC